jgi:hypothetical protein
MSYRYDDEFRDKRYYDDRRRNDWNHYSDRESYPRYRYDERDTYQGYYYNDHRPRFDNRYDSFRDANVDMNHSFGHDRYHNNGYHDHDYDYRNGAQDGKYHSNSRYRREEVDERDVRRYEHRGKYIIPDRGNGAPHGNYNFRNSHMPNQDPKLDVEETQEHDYGQHMSKKQPFEKPYDNRRLPEFTQSNEPYVNILSELTVNIPISEDNKLKLQKIRSHFRDIEIMENELIPMQKEKLELLKGMDAIDFKFYNSKFKVSQAIRRVYVIEADLMETEKQIGTIEENGIFPDSTWKMPDVPDF